MILEGKEDSEGWGYLCVSIYKGDMWEAKWEFESHLRQTQKKKSFREDTNSNKILPNNFLFLFFNLGFFYFYVYLL